MHIPNGYADIYSYANSYGYAYSNSNPYRYTYSNPYCYCDTNRDTSYAYTNCYRDSYADS